MTQLTPTSDKPVFGAIAMALVTLVLAFAQVSTVRAQWTTGTDIHNTNSGNVGIGTGTTSPAQALEVKSSGGTRTRITMADGSSGGLELYTSGGTFKGGLLYWQPGNITSFYGPDSGTGV